MILNFSPPKNNINQPKEKINEQKYRVPVIHIDHFGNVILNLSRKDFAELGKPDNLQILWNGFTLKGIRETFGNVSESELLLIWDSSDYLQIAVNGGNAAEKLGLELFNEVEMIL